MPSALGLGFPSLHTGMRLCSPAALLGRTSHMLLELGSPFCPPFANPPPTPSCVWPGGGRGEGEVHPHATEINFLPINFRCRKIYHHLLSPFCGVDIESKHLPPCRGVGGVPGLFPGASPSAPLSSPQILCLGVTSLDQASVSSPELIISHPYSQAHKEAIMMSSCWFEK